MLCFLAVVGDRCKSGDRTMLTRKQLELLRFIHERLTETGVPPSFDEMKDALDLRSKSGIHRLITASRSDASSAGGRTGHAPSRSSSSPRAAAVPAVSPRA